MKIDYKDTVCLPKTDFPMKAGLAKKESEILSRWEKINLYKQHRKIAKGREKFILHDGPPYANGNLHIGHALNKILKDVVTRSQQMLGKDSNYVPGWDCHGLPIEWKIEEKYRKKGEDKDQIPIVDFRKECRDFAEGWIEIQKEEFKRLGVIGDWANPYTTMSYEAEAAIVAELGKFILNGGLYRGAKPVLWSVVEKTALAEAEVEYKDHTSNTIFTKFPIIKSAIKSLVDNSSIVIWTTTPWTIPGNRGIAYSANNEYLCLLIKKVEPDSEAMVNDKVVVAESLLEEFCQGCHISEYNIVDKFNGSHLEGTHCIHPFSGKGYDFEVPLLPADFVDMETGTGFVHIAPGHGYDDWVLGMEYGLPVPETVLGNGLYTDKLPIFGGQHVFKADPLVIEELRASNSLLAASTIEHSYPHSWRSKAPLIFRNTPQWFISMDTGQLRQKAMDAISNTNFFPKSGKSRLSGMIETRPDWCISRQRAWGVPICVFVNKKTGKILKDQEVIDRIVESVRENGADVWFEKEASHFLGTKYDTNEFEQVTDILDVWFDSGSTHSFVLENRSDLQWPASLYLEGTDQHRGWFHSSLLESCGTRGRAPYNAVLTHGFVMAEDGQKMSKSLGNITAPQEVIESHGADILRLWVVGSDYSEDLRIGPEILKHYTDIYRRLRNTLRYLIGNLSDFSEKEKIDRDSMPEIERWVLNRVYELDKSLRQSCESFEFHNFFNELHNFCSVDLSAFYFDIRKDTLYCDRRDSITRQACRTVLDNLFRYLTTWLAPFLCFTSEEAWLSRFPSADGSVHLNQFPDVPDSWYDVDLARKWIEIRDIRKVVTGALEIERSEKRMGSSLQASPTVYLSAEKIGLLNELDCEEIFITSDATLKFESPPKDSFRLDEIEGVGVIVNEAEGNKCIRCYKISNEVGTIKLHDELCKRCADAVDHFIKNEENL